MNSAIINFSSELISCAQNISAYNELHTDSSEQSSPYCSPFMTIDDYDDSRLTISSLSLISNLNNSSIDGNQQFIINLNDTKNATLEEELDDFIQKMRGQARPEILVYVVLFLIGGAANLYVLSHLIRERSPSRMNHFIRHLTIADSIVIFVTISIEIIWRLTISWRTGNIGCKLAQFARAFGLYLTSAILICISVDRYYAFIHPLSVLNSEDRNKIYLVISYFGSLMLCIPQLIVFQVEYHPKFGELFGQCQTRSYFANHKFLEQCYTIGTMVGMYLVPLVVVVYCYTAIIRCLHISANQGFQAGQYKSFFVGLVHDCCHQVVPRYKCDCMLIPNYRS